MEAARILIAGMWLQDAGGLSSGNSRLLEIFVGIVAFAMAIQAAAIVVAAIGALKIGKRSLEIVEEVRLKSLPIIDTAHSVMHDLHPKVRVIADNLVETTHVVRAKAQEFDSTITDVNERARAQAARVDDMVSSVLDTASAAGSAAQKAVKVPVREFSGLVAGLKAGIDVLVGRDKRSGNHHNRQVKDYEDGSIGY